MRPAKKVTTWPGHANAWASSAPAPACSTRCGTPASFALGLVAGRVGDATSLGFVVETEHQVEKHLQGHLDTLPDNDLASRVIVEQMKADEIRHAEMAERAGATPLPRPVQWAMRAAAKVMTGTAHHI